MSTPPDSPRPFDDFPNPLSFPLPSGTYTLLDVVEKCDNIELPTGPWEARDCKRRWERHAMSTMKLHRRESNNGHNSSALDDEDDEDDNDEDEADATTAARSQKHTSEFDKEFLCPLFVELPKDPSIPVSASNPPSRRGSSTSLSRPSFTRLTPMPTLRPSSPTSAHPTFFPTPTSTEATPPQPIGFLRPSIVKALIEDNRKMVAVNCRPVWAFLPPIHFPPPVRRHSSSRSRPSSRRSSHSVHPMTSSSANQSGPGTPNAGASGLPTSPTTTEGGALSEVIEGLRTIAAGEDLTGPNFSKGPYAVGFEEWVNEEGQEARREHVDRLVRNWKMSGEFKECLGGWRDELYSVYGPRSTSDNPLPGSNVVFKMERSACALFGVTTFGVHCTAYVEEEGQPLKLWVPRRSANKQTWPSFLDNTVAGGITAGDSPRESIIRECAEEATLPASYVAQHIRSTGCVVYNYRTSDGYLQPEVQYVYDLKLPAEGGPTPTTNPDDGEVESFELMTLEDVLHKMVEGEFKPNCALVLVDFFARHGYLTPESDARYLEVMARLRRPMILPSPA